MLEEPLPVSMHDPDTHFNKDYTFATTDAALSEMKRTLGGAPDGSTNVRDKHTRDWIHGVPKTRSLITYTSHPNSEDSSANEAYLVPEFTLTDVSAGWSSRHSSLDITNSPDDQCDSMGAGAMLQSDDFESSFSGLLHVPSFSFTRPDNVKAHADISQYFLHSHFEVGEVTYFFGGLQSDPLRALKNLGIPRSTDPSLISVHFPCDMPPFVNKDLLMSPLITRNPCLFLFNPTRSTVHDHSKPCLDDFEAGQFCDMRGTQISEFQVFFCGGFKINVDRVEFDKTKGRWIVEKSISTNDSGFVLDVRNLSFTKISLLSRPGQKYCGRLGTAVCSNYSFDKSVQNSSFIDSHIPSSANLNECVYGSESLLSASKQSVPSPRSSSPVTFQSTNSTQITQESKIQAKNQISAGSLITKASKAVESSDPYLDHKDRTSSKDKFSVISNDVSGSKQGSSPRNTEFGTGGSSIESTSLAHPALAQVRTLQAESKKGPLSEPKKIHKSAEASLSSGHRVPAIIAKSSRFFHRNSSKHSSMTSTTSSSQCTHLKHARQHKTKPVTTSDSGIRHLHPMSPKSSDSIYHANDAESAKSSTSSSFQSISHSNIREEAALCECQVPPYSVGEKSIVDHCKSSDQSSPNYNLALQDNDQKSGISSVCVYLFGGFTLNTVANSRQGFSATNDLLKLELIISDSLASDFHLEALVDTISPKNGTFPGPRGYFAHVLTSSSMKNEACNFTGPGSGGSNNFEHYGDPKIRPSSVGLPHMADLDQSQTQANMRLIIHGGVDESYQVHGDCFYFNFETESWIPLDTYAFDYYEISKRPCEDEDSERLQLKTQVENAKLVDAELRCCHHKATVYWEGDKEYLAFVGGFTNDFLRHYDSIPYESSKFDVSRLAKLSVSLMNSNLLRIPVLNLRSQVWKFKRYFYDLTESAKSGFIDLMKHDCMKNSSLAINGGGVSIVGKQLTICHGIVQFVPEKAADFESIAQVLENSSILLGGHFHLTFPGM